MSVIKDFPPMKQILSLALLLIPWLLPQPAFAQAQQPLPRFTPSQLQRITSALYRFDSQDFFRRGQQQIENEIKILNQRRLLTEGVLKISPDVLKQPDFTQFERPGLVNEIH
ncbi:hypothetical protein J5X98_02365 [Leptothermofonsia sichuanensis E412]|uniref:hypothetical protein n=1 Tax=Leptothermofonsia sichuanensis TaxID=2917832 RepID=UPI001CA7407E|nr:hypothetical protein [Leptothermofonsia sichuanensis]QZZ21348.1 hypothetical protein J5X98_02365 [Leptothermofonsia sichuanensis E412]